MAADLNLEVPRNGHYQQDWQLSDSDGAPLDITDVYIDLQIRAVAGQGSVLATASLDKPTPLEGKFTVTISGGDFSSVPGYGEVVALAYDLRQTFLDAITQVLVRGQIYLMPGVTA